MKPSDSSRLLLSNRAKPGVSRRRARRPGRWARGWEARGLAGEWVATRGGRNGGLACQLLRAMEQCTRTLGLGWKDQSVSGHGVYDIERPALVPKSSYCSTGFRNRGVGSPQARLLERLHPAPGSSRPCAGVRGAMWQLSLSREGPVDRQQRELRGHRFPKDTYMYCQKEIQRTLEIL